jgi:mRNA interferase MazF
VVAQGEIWLLETPNGKARPALVVSRNEAIPVLNNVIVAPLTTTIRPIPTNVPVGADEGIERESVASLDNLASVPKSALTVRLGAVGAHRREELCRALRVLADC